MTNIKSLGMLTLLVTLSLSGESLGFFKKKPKMVEAPVSSESYDPGPGHENTSRHQAPVDRKQCLMQCDRDAHSLRASSKGEAKKKLHNCKVKCPKPQG